MSDDDSLSPRRAQLELLAISLVVLAAELTLIRWLPGKVRVLAYFPNLVLLSAFLGLGVGSLLASRRALLTFFPPLLLLLGIAAQIASGVAFTHDAPNENFWLLYYDLGESAPVFDDVRLPIVGFFFLSAATFFPLGQAVARRLEVLRQDGRPLVGYMWDLGGSLLGVIIFAALSFAGTPPAVWFGVVLSVSLVLAHGSRLRMATWVVCGVALIGLVAVGEKAERYSPYYALSMTPPMDDGGIGVLANGSLHQIFYDMAPANDGEVIENIREGYRSPYEALARPIRKALVLGAGTGNDVSVLLALGAAEVHAVEIDPVILEFGRLHNPSRPYVDPRVTLFNTDGRAHLNNTDEKYDVITFGTLDSMTRLSALSNVRLDNFIYTRESIDAARSHLTADGVLVMFFMVGREYISTHLEGMLTASFGQRPLVKQEYRHLFNTAYMSGPGTAHLRPEGGTDTPVVRASYPTDDWPYLYLERPGVSPLYTSLIALLFALSAIVLLLVSPALRAAMRAGDIDVEMMFFGAAFLLLETKLVTSMSLVWGATWLTSAVVFGSILAVVLAGTWLSHVKPPSRWLAMAGLLVCMVITWMIPEAELVGRAWPIRLLLSGLYAGAPIYFASLCFASRFRERAHVDLAFGWNLLGSVCGGLLEFGTMAFGLSAMHALAGLIYFGVLLLWLRARARAGG